MSSSNGSTTLPDDCESTDSQYYSMSKAGFFLGLAAIGLALMYLIAYVWILRNLERTIKEQKEKIQLLSRTDGVNPDSELTSPEVINVPTESAIR